MYFGVIKFPLRLIQTNDVKLEDKDINKLDRNVVDLPPLIITYEIGKFYCMLQKDDFLKLKQQRVNVYQAVIVLKGNADYKLFMKQYGNVFHYYGEV